MARCATCLSVVGIRDGQLRAAVKREEAEHEHEAAERGELRTNVNHEAAQHAAPLKKARTGTLWPLRS